MGFRFRRRIGPKGFKINITQNGISSVSLGGRGLSYNIPVNRKGGARTTVGIPGTGLSWDYQEPGTRRTSDRRIDAPAFSPDEDAYWAEHALWESKVAKLSVPTPRPVPAGKDSLLTPETERGLTLLRQFQPLKDGFREVDWVLEFETLGAAYQNFQDRNGFSDDNWRIKYLEEFHKWLQLEFKREVELKTAAGEEPEFEISNSQSGIKQLSPEQQKREWMIALMVIGVGAALTMALAGGVSTVQRPSRPSVNPIGWNAQQAIEAKAKREVAAFKRRQEEEKRYQEKLAARNRAGNAMRAAGYWKGPGGGCLTRNSKGNQKYVSRNICQSFFRAEGLEF